MASNQVISNAKWKAALAKRPPGGAKALLNWAHDKGYKIEGIDPTVPGQGTLKMAADLIPPTTAILGGLATAEMGGVPGAMAAGGMGTIIKNLAYKAGGLEPPPAGGLMRMIPGFPEHTPEALDPVLGAVDEGANQFIGNKMGQGAAAVGSRTINTLNGMRQSLKYNPGMTAIANFVGRGVGGMKRAVELLKPITAEIRQHLANSTATVDPQVFIADVLYAMRQKMSEFKLPDTAMGHVANAAREWLTDPANGFVAMGPNGVTSQPITIDRFYKAAASSGHLASQVFDKRAWGQMPQEAATKAFWGKQFDATLNRVAKSHIYQQIPELEPLDQQASKLLNLEGEISKTISRGGVGARLAQTLGPHVPAVMLGANTYMHTQNESPMQRVMKVGGATLAGEAMGSPRLARTGIELLSKSPYLMDYIGSANEDPTR